MAKIHYEISWWSNGKKLKTVIVKTYGEYQDLINHLETDKVGFFRMSPRISFDDWLSTLTEEDKSHILV